MARYTTIEGDMIDDICHRWYGRSSGTMEVVMAVNPHIREQPEQLPAGLLIELPDIAPAAKEKRVQLWD